MLAFSSLINEPIFTINVNFNMIFTILHSKKLWLKEKISLQMAKSNLHCSVVHAIFSLSNLSSVLELLSWRANLSTENCFAISSHFLLESFFLVYYLTSSQITNVDCILHTKVCQGTTIHFDLYSCFMIFHYQFDQN